MKTVDNTTECGGRKSRSGREKENVTGPWEPPHRCKATEENRYNVSERIELTKDRKTRDGPRTV